MNVRGGLQPHRKGALTRQPGPVLSAMMRGADLHGNNPADDQRAGQRQPKRSASRPAARAARPARSARPAR